MTSPTSPRPITVYGRTTCEDTAIARDRLRHLNVPFTDVHLDLDPSAAPLVESLNNGNQVTPTILFGGIERPMSEPSLDALDARLAEEGWPIHRPGPARYGPDTAADTSHVRSLVHADGSAFDLDAISGHHPFAVFFAHAPDCRVCSGYARQLAAVASDLAEGNSRPLVVVSGDADVAATWRAESTDRIPIVGDPSGRWKASVVAQVAPAEDGPVALLVALDANLVPRFGSHASDAGGLITPLQAAEWLAFDALNAPGPAPG